jgi:hypothetical protein
MLKHIGFEKEKEEKTRERERCEKYEIRIIYH